MIVLDGTSGITSPNETVTGQFSSGSTFAYKNRIINGGMVIDQRNAGASVTPVNAQYSVDRWAWNLTQASKFTTQQNAGSVTPPVGFSNYLGVTSSSAYSVLTGDYFYFTQKIEGFNTADLAWGTANASTVTVSFWVRSSLTGTFGGGICNDAGNRSYPFSYSIPVANTWTQISVTIAGDITGTWIGATNGNGLNLRLSLGVGATYSGTAGAWVAGNIISATGAVSVVGTSGATFYITGVQLEKGSVATSFDQRAYGTELALCQRYYESTFSIGSAPVQNGGGTNVLRISQTAAAGAPCRGFTWIYKTTKRDTPSTITSYNPSAANANVRNFTRSNDATISGVTGINTIGITFSFTSSAGSAVGDDNGVGFSADAEL